MRHLLAPAVFLLAGLPFNAMNAGEARIDVKQYGAKADGKTPDGNSINKAIEATAAAGGGVIYFPAGRYLTGSIRLRDHITLHLEPGAVLVASPDAGTYDPAEPNESNKFQDFGHSHWHNSLIWGEKVRDVAIVGGGLIDGNALTRGLRNDGPNKTIALKLSRNVTIRDVSILSAGHFGILATGVDNLTIDNVKIDTNRDGIDIDACHNVRISNASVNSPNDDAIVLKSTHALGFRRATEGVTITNSFVSGYDVGTLLDGTYGRTLTKAPDRDGPTGRVKIGTESEGDFHNITISNVVFEHSRGLALESVDGANIEDISISNLTMRDVSNAPIFLRLGSRMRAPDGTAVGSIRRVNISNVVAYDADPRYGAIISGIPGHDLEDVSFSNIRLGYRGGLSLEQAANQPPDLVNTFFFRGTGGIPKREPYDVPEREKEYPEPSMFGLMPAYGFYIRHARGIYFHNLEVDFAAPEKRPAVVLDHATDVEFDRVRAEKSVDAPVFVLRDVENIAIRNSLPLPDARIDRASRKEM